ncbi:B12-binding domain-containing radical SAM protein [Mangrovihabitans endophyticus]|uniref:B12-binding domain-containing radical SAM protein n=1 Tax=Mangrovihabitans endophyticus TaxID=1751298 RepID=UPI0016629CB0|nr:radical SAM protein [Mangrovihabitans endophyticus]
MIVFPHVGYCTGWRPHLATAVKNGSTYHIAQALTYLYSIARHYTDDVIVVDFNFGEHDDNLARVLDYRPDAVLISSTVNSYDSTKQIAAEVDANSGARLFIGGPAVSSNHFLRPELLEVGVPCEFVVTNKNIFDWVGKVFGNEDKSLQFRTFVPDNRWLSETYPAEVREKLRYTVITSIGCTYKCHFCLNPMVYKINYKDPEILRGELEFLAAELGAGSVSVADPFFFMRQAHSNEIMDVFADLGMPWSQQTCLVTLTDENLDRMAETRCTSVLVGIENFSSGEINKPVEVSQFEDRVLRAKSLGIAVKPSFISGLLDIDYETDVAQIEYIESIIARDLVGNHQIQSNIYSPYIPDARDRLLDVPFRFWGVMPVTAADEDHWRRNLALCDLIYDRVFPETRERYQEVRAEYLDYLAGRETMWLKHRPVPQVPLDKRVFVLTSGTVRA